jgi:hypothetical protein
VRRAAHVPSWWKSSRTVLQAGSVAKGGGNASPGVTGSGRGGGVEWAMRYGSGKWAPGQETPGMSACCLWCGSRGAPAVVVVPRAGRAGQGAHREVGSEGFAAKRRAVAEQGEPVGQSPGETEPALRRRRKYLECLGASGCVRAARRERSMRYPGRSRTVPCPTGRGTWAYKPPGEVAGEAVREVGVTRGTHEPGTSTSPGTVLLVGRRAATQTAPTRGKGSRWEMASRVGDWASRWAAG